MSWRIKPFRRTGATGQPNIALMEEGEIAVNSYDQKIWMRVGSNLIEVANASTPSWSDISGKPATATRWPTWSEVTGKPSIPTSADYVATSGNQTGLSGDKTWAGTHTFGTSSGIVDIYLASGGAQVGGIFADPTRAVVHASAGGYVSLRPGGRGSTTGEFKADSSGATWNGNEVWHAGNLTPSNYALASRSITAGNGLSGGGTLAANRTLTLGTPDTVSQDTTNGVTATSHTHNVVMSYLWNEDDRSGTIRTTPDTYRHRGLSVGFNTGANTGLPGTYGMTLHLAPWTAWASSYRQQQLGFPGVGGDFYYRTATSSTTWGGWNKVWHEGNFTPSDYTPTGRSITAGNGLSGGGNFTANRTISLGTPGTLSGSTNNAVQTSSHTHALSTNLKAWDGYHPDNAFVDKGTIPGSVNLNTYRTTGIYHQNANADATSGTNYPANVAGMLTVFESGSMTYQTYQVYNTGDVYTRSRYNTSWSAWKLSVDGTTTISAGNGLTGGGNLTSNRTITLGTPGTITATSTNSVSTSSHTHNLDTTGNFTWNGNHIFVGDMIARSSSASLQMTVERTGNSINSAIAYTTTGGTVYAGQGDNGSFNWGTGTDIRWSNANSWARLNSTALSVKGSISANGNVTSTSDPRLKDDIKKVKARRELIEKLEYFSFKWKKDGVEGRSIMADKVQEIAPEHVHVGEEDGMLSVDKGALALEMVFALLDKLKEES